MSETETAALPAAEPATHMLEFHGQGGEFFRIWIVNIVLTVLTLGIYSAWAKVRTTRYFYGNTALAGHPFDYHASPVRILVGRVIAVGLLLGYSISVQIQPKLAFAWLIVFVLVTPWLVVSSLRFAARNSSYRNVRFNFVGTMRQAATAYVFYPVLVAATAGLTAPLARRVRDYFYINNHTFGGKAFHTEFSGGRIYLVYLAALGFFIAGILAMIALAVPIAMFSHIDFKGMTAKGPPQAALFIGIAFVFYVLFFSIIALVGQILNAMILNLAVGNAVLDGRHKLICRLSPLRMAWIALTNLLLTLVTLGFFYPWAHVRLSRYQFQRMGLNAQSSLDEFTSEAIATQGAIGEEIAGFFDLGIGI